VINLGGLGAAAGGGALRCRRAWPEGVMGAPEPWDRWTGWASCPARGPA